MNLAVVFALLSRIILGAGLLLLPPLGLNLFTGGPVTGFLLSLAAALIISFVLQKKGKIPKSSLTPREGMAVTALAWISVSLLYSLPYFFSETLSLPDSLVESISGLTGTGATMINDIPALSEGLLLFRSLTHWVGGLGIIVFFVALFPQAGRVQAKMVSAESTGPTSSKALPRIKETTAAIFVTYLVFTAAAAVSFALCGMAPLDALENALSVIPTGGFATKNESIAYYNNPLLEMVIVFFMLLSSANFGLYVAARKKGLSVVWKDKELRLFLSIVLGSTLLITISLVLQSGTDILRALRDSLFTVSSVSSTTGYVTADFDKWPPFCRLLLLFLFFVGGCAGSTTGGFKVIRLLLLGKILASSLRLVLHPRQVIHVRLGDEPYSEAVLFRILAFFALYLGLVLLWALLFAFDGIAFNDALGLSFSTMGNIGPAFGQFGATCTYASLPPLSKGVVCLSMLMGRLEIIPLAVLFFPSFWKRSGW